MLIGSNRTHSSTFVHHRAQVNGVHSSDVKTKHDAHHSNSRGKLLKNENQRRIPVNTSHYLIMRTINTSHYLIMRTINTSHYLIMRTINTSHYLIMRTINTSHYLIMRTINTSHYRDRVYLVAKQIIERVPPRNNYRGPTTCDGGF
jgi:cell division protein ZapA (FtsZ GTPase activity inhibitor)